MSIPKLVLITIIASIMIGLPVWAADAGKAGKQSGSTDTTGSVPTDANFIDSMVMHHQGAIEMSQQALKESAKPEIKKFSQNTISNQKKEIVQLRVLRQEWYHDLPPTEGMGIGKGTTLSQTDNSKPFDQRFLNAMISHHEQAIAMAEKMEKQAQHKQLREFASKTLSDQKSELTQLKKWRKEWFGS